MDHLVMPPDTDLHDLLGCVWDQVDFDVFVQLHIGDFDGVIEQRDSSVAVDDSGLAQAEDVLGRSVGLGQGERAEEAMAIFLGSSEADTGNLFSSGVDLVVVVAINLVLEDGTDLLHCRDLLQGTGSDDAIL